MLLIAKRSNREVRCCCFFFSLPIQNSLIELYNVIEFFKDFLFLSQCNTSSRMGHARATRIIPMTVTVCIMRNGIEPCNFNTYTTTAIQWSIKINYILFIFLAHFQ